MGIERPNKLISHLMVVMITLILGACSSGSDEGSSDAFSFGGSIGDGPIVDAEVTVEDANGDVVATTTSDQFANYSVDIPENTPVPVTIRVTGGTDLVTQRAADFELVAQAYEAGRQTINVSPLTTLAVKAAECRGDVSLDGVNQSWDDISQQFVVGLDTTELGDPMSQLITQDNVETAVLANEALGELVRRTGAALTDVSLEEVVDVLACDLANGRIDGDLAAPVTSDDARVFAVAKAIEVDIRIQVMRGALEVDGADATALMNDAIRTIMPELANPNVSEVVVDQASIDQAVMAIAMLQELIPDSELTDLMVALSGVAPAAANGFAQALDTVTINTLAGLAARVAVSDDTQINDLVDRAAEQETTLPPTLSFSASSTLVEPGGSTSLSWASADADQCTGSWSDGTVEFQGSFAISNLARTTTYQFVCAGLGGGSSATVTVRVNDPNQPEPEPEPNPPSNPNPTPGSGLSLTFQSDVQTADVGGTVRLTWSSEGASSCQASGAWSGAKGVSGSENVTISGNATFTLTCSGGGSSVVEMVSVSAIGGLEISWQAPTQNDDGTPVGSLNTYEIYYGQISGNYGAPVRVAASQSSHTLALPIGDYFVAMKVVDAAGVSSDFSNEVWLRAR